MNNNNSKLPSLQLILDSSQADILRDNGATATFNLTEGLQFQSESQIANIQLLQFHARHTIYNITSSNNQLEILVQKFNDTFTALDTTNTSTIITIPVGYYNIDELLITVNTAINNVCLPLLRSDKSSYATKYYYNGFGLPTGDSSAIEPISFNSVDGTVTFKLPTLSVLSDKTTTGTYSTTSGITGNSVFANNIYSGFYVLNEKYTGLLSTLGFDVTKNINLPTANIHYGFGTQLKPSVSYTNNTISVSYTTNYLFTNMINNANTYTIDSTLGDFMSCCLVDLSYPQCIHISVDGMSTKNRSSLQQMSSGNLFTTIPIDCSFGDTILYAPMIPFSFGIANFQLNSLTIHTFDQNGKLIDWNHGNWRIHIGINWEMDVARDYFDHTNGRRSQPILLSAPHDALLDEENFRKRYRM